MLNNSKKNDMIFSKFHSNWKKKINALFNSRPVVSAEEFLNMMVIRGHDSEIVKIVYQEISNYLPKVKVLSIYPDDNLIEDYDIDHEDIEDIVVRIMEKNKINIPSEIQQEEFYNKYGEQLTMEKIIQLVEFAINKQQ